MEKLKNLKPTALAFYGEAAFQNDMEIFGNRKMQVLQEDYFELSTLNRIEFFSIHNDNKRQLMNQD